MLETIIKAAIIQAEPEYYNLAATVEKAVSLIHEAAGKGAQLITFGETWFPGYPVWLDICTGTNIWDSEPTKEVFARLYHNSPTINGAEMNRLREVAKELGVVLVLSINERVEKSAGHGTLYNSLVTIDATGNIVNHHRKLVPTFTERIVWGAGDGAGLQAVDTTVGRVGGLICWEHWMPHARQALHESAEKIHVAVWPAVTEMMHIASRHYAFEGRTFVLASGTILHTSAMPKELEVEAGYDAKLAQRGGSAIIAPDGSVIAGPVYDEETILIADLDLNMIVKESMTLDVTGHYSRPDVFDFIVNRGKRSIISQKD